LQKSKLEEENNSFAESKESLFFKKAAEYIQQFLKYRIFAAEN
jgi:hypothetical protein